MIGKYCPKCGNTGLSNFCYRDGTEMIQRPQCECGYVIMVGADKFCPDCGKQINEEVKHD